ncbi:hypothetical protein Bpfe_011663 [Biomphalaria pfeifferi]|uniref:Uncharacterized protein n=1 Tax=Biomphalaria pfeifferi TaxID=112525 RepID=A0AAD8BQY2_BIOPF|nr:hypothetical protein Bpfe_011663 [Biomphalaria pfeifferi]
MTSLAELDSSKARYDLRNSAYIDHRYHIDHQQWSLGNESRQLGSDTKRLFGIGDYLNDYTRYVDEMTVIEPLPSLIPTKSFPDPFAQISMEQHFSSPRLDETQRWLSRSPGLDETQRWLSRSPGLDETQRWLSRSSGLDETQRWLSRSPGLDETQRWLSRSPGLEETQRWPCKLGMRCRRNPFHVETRFPRHGGDWLHNWTEYMYRIGELGAKQLKQTSQ